MSLVVSVAYVNDLVYVVSAIFLYPLYIILVCYEISARLYDVLMDICRVTGYLDNYTISVVPSITYPITHLPRSLITNSTQLNYTSSYAQSFFFVYTNNWPPGLVYVLLLTSIEYCKYINYFYGNISRIISNKYVLQ